ncbi:MAG: hypothetical protein ACJ746_24840 [Bryobacteraceae bacterium]
MDKHNERDWGKHGVIAGYVFGIATLVLGILTYVRPPDPAHPISFDFLSRMIAVPFWLAVMLLLATAALAFAITMNVEKRKRLLRPPVIATETPRAIDSIKVLKRDVIEDPGATHKRKIWFYIQNQGQTCLRLADPDWKYDQGSADPHSRIRGQMVYRVFNLQIDKEWLPKDGLNPICLAPGAQCRLWVEPLITYDTHEIRARCQSPNPIGTISMKLNGESVDIPV